MKSNLSTILVQERKIGVIKVGKVNYISLTDLARYSNEIEPKIPIQVWMRNKDVISYLGLWENMNNENFKGYEFVTFKNEAGSNKFNMSPQKWIGSTGAIGIISKSGRYNSGTYAHPDIAFEFASWLSPEFKLYLITEFERLKLKEANENKIEWNTVRLLSKINYMLHTNAINKYIVPNLTEEQLESIYSEEADVLNVALFGMTAKEWKDNNPNIEGNIRDYSSLLELIILNNLESINSELIKEGILQKERLIRLNKLAKEEVEIIKNNENLKLLEK